MNRVVESATESAADVQANLGLLSDVEKVDDNKSAPAEKPAEKIEESETSETDEDVDDAAEDESVKDESKEDKPKKKNGGFQKKIGKLTAAREKALQEAEYWKAQALKGNSQEAPKENLKANDNKEPVPDDFDSYTDFVRASLKWELANEKQKEIQENAKKSQLTAEQEKAKKIQSIVDEFVLKNEDYHDVVSDVDDVEVQNGLIALIRESENPALLNYELAKNRDELIRINSLEPRKAQIELLKFEAKLQASSVEKTQQKRITPAARPLSPVSSSSKSYVDKSPYEKDMTYEEYKAWSAKQKK